MKRFPKGKPMPPDVGGRHSLGFNAGWFHDECWRASVHVIWPVGPEEMRNYIRYQFGLDWDPGTGEPGGRCIEVVGKNGLGCANIIALRDWDPTSPSSVSILAHEAFHAAEHILSDRATPHKESVTSETFAYLIESIVRRSMEILGQKPAFLSHKNS